MKAGNLNRMITIQQFTRSEPDDYGNVTEGWTLGYAVMAQLVSLSTEEFLKAYGETSTAVLVFRIRWRPNVSNDNLVAFNGRFYDIREVQEIGYRAGLELRCEERQA